MSKLPALNPSASTFSITKPISPTASNTSTHDSASSWATVHTPTSVSSNSTFSEKKVKPFLDGWKTASLDEFSDSFATIRPSQVANLRPPINQVNYQGYPIPSSTNNNLRRARSPSLPVLPSQLAPTHGQNKIEDDHLRSDAAYNITRDLTGLTVTESTGATPHKYNDPFILTPPPKKFPTHIPGGHGGYLSTIKPSLVHHASTPNLSNGRKGSLGHVRFIDDVDEEEEDDEPAFIIPGHIKTTQGGTGIAQLLGSRSMSDLVEVSRGKNVWIHDADDLAAGMTSEQLEKIASQFGPVQSVSVKPAGDLNAAARGPTSGQSARYCGFVLFVHQESARSFLGHLQERNIACDYGKGDFQIEWMSREDRESSNIYVQGLPLSLSEEDILRLLSQYGHVVSRNILATHGVRRGPVMARYETRGQAETAIKALNNKLFGPPGNMVQARIADSEPQKRLKKQASSLYSNDSFESQCGPAFVNRRQMQEIEDAKRYHFDQIADLEARQRHVSHTRSASSIIVTPGRNDRRKAFPSMGSQPNVPDQWSPSGHHTSSNWTNYSSQSYDTSVPALSPATSRSVSTASAAAGIWMPPCPPVNPVSTRFNYDAYAPLSHRSASSSQDIITPKANYEDHRHDLVSTAERTKYGNNLHHTRSSPEIGKDYVSPAKLLWPDATSRDL